MQSGVYEAQLKQSRTRAAIGIVLAALLIAAGVLGTAVSMILGEKSITQIDAEHPAHKMETGGYAFIETRDFYYSGYFLGDADEEEKADAYYYYILIYDEDDTPVEIVPAEAKADYRADEDLEYEQRPLRTFKGTLVKESQTYWNAYVEDLAQWLEISEDAASSYLSPYTVSKAKPSVLPLWLLAIAGAFLLYNSISNAKGTKKQQERMAGYAVTEAALHQFDQEYSQGYDRFGPVDVTQSWIFNRSLDSTSVLPLREIVWLYRKDIRHYTNGIYSGTNYTIELRFSDGGAMSIANRKKKATNLLETLAARCPNAFVGHTPEIKADWEQDYTRVVRASQERARAMENPAREEALAAADESTAAAEQAED